MCNLLRDVCVCMYMCMYRNIFLVTLHTLMNDYLSIDYCQWNRFFLARKISQTEIKSKKTDELQWSTMV